MVNAHIDGQYSVSGKPYYPALNVSMVRVMKSGTAPDSEQITIELLEDNPPGKCSIKLAPSLAIVLARTVLSVAKGYISEAVSKVA